MKHPELVTATQAELDEILALTKTTLPPQQYQLLEAVLRTFVYVMQALQNAKTSLKRFRRMLFGALTESSANVLEAHDTDAPVSSVNAEHAGDTVAPTLADTTALDAADDGAPPQAAGTRAHRRRPIATRPSSP
jgi:hypothetical protein